MKSMFFVRSCASVLDRVLIRPFDRDRLDEIKRLKEDIEQARIESELALRRGDLSRASELVYSVIPGLEKRLPQDR